MVNEGDKLLTNGVYAPELEWVSNGDKFLIKDENGDELGFEDDDEVSLVEGVLRGALCA